MYAGVLISSFIVLLYLYKNSLLYNGIPLSKFLSLINSSRPCSLNSANVSFIIVFVDVSHPPTVSSWSCFTFVTRNDTCLRKVYFTMANTAHRLDI